MKKNLTIKGVKENNLKNFDIEIPLDKIVAVTGISGSGKSSLVFDTLAKEGQRRFLQSFSGYSRQFLNKFHRPAVENIEGLRPILTVNQKTTAANPRSTIGTMTEIYDLLRLLYARFATNGDLPAGIKQDRSLFSFNSPKGACPECNGLGVSDEIDIDKLIKDPSLTLREGVLTITTPSGYIIYSQVTMEVLNQVCEANGFNVDIPWNEMTEEQKHIVLNGSDKIKIPYGKHTLESRMKWSGITARPREEGFYKGILPVMDYILKKDRNDNILRFAKTIKCQSCNGSRLRPEALGFKYNGKNIANLCEMSVIELESFFKDISKALVAEQEVINRILEKFKILVRLGLSYLSINRESTSLSGGEAQRIRLANQLTNKLSGLLYILDEPSIGLHPADQEALLEVIRELSENNSILLVEHDKDAILSADHLVDIGPEAGVNGGEMLYNGSLKDFIDDDSISNSITRKHLLEKILLPVPEKRTVSEDKIILKGVRQNNLKNINVEFGLNCLNLVTGVSGSGKSSLVNQCLSAYLQKKINNSNVAVGDFDEIEGDDMIKRIIEIDQSPIGRTPRSNPATYTKAFDLIRDIFGKEELAKAKGWDKSFFSFNNKKGGRCTECEGAGVLTEGFHFLGNFEKECPACHGKRYSEETLEVKHKGKNIHEVLEMSIEEAEDFFSENKKLHLILKTMNELGLGYLTLGQSSVTLSGGEAQRIKLASELAKQSKNHCLYILDEPSTGLHQHDLAKLLHILLRLKENGHTIIVIEHHSDFILQADHVIDLGPGSGDLGGNLIFSGSPEGLMENQNSITGDYLKKALETVPQAKIQESSATRSEEMIFEDVSTNNLKEISFNIPKNKITAVTGVSGSGKSSLAFDTVYTEGWQRYIENFSSYARSQMNIRSKADIGRVNGIQAAVAIGKKASNINVRSTVGSYTGISDYLRLLYSREAHSEGLVIPDLTSSHFSNNHQDGACESCKGLGYNLSCDPEKLITHPELSIIDGAMKGTKTGRFYGDPTDKHIATLSTMAASRSIDLNIAWEAIDQQTEDLIMYGSGEEVFDVVWSYKRKNRTGTHEFSSPWQGFVALVNEEYVRKTENGKQDQLADLMTEIQCESCGGSGLISFVEDYRINGLNIIELMDLSIDQLDNEILKLNSGSEASHQLILLIREKTEMMKLAGLGHLKLGRRTKSLSGGELQRCGLAAQASSGMQGVLYVLDEPGRSLHSRDKQNINKLIKKLNEQNNTILMVEHDPQMVGIADHMIEMGPEGGKNGGQIIFNGETDGFIDSFDQLSTKLHNQRNTTKAESSFRINKATANNLKNIDIEFVSPGINLITGISGSGKSSLLVHTLNSSLEKGKAVNCESIDGLEQFSDFVLMGQEHHDGYISSTPLTITGIFDELRNLLANTEEAKAHKLQKKHFSYLNKEGQCPDCKGLGSKRTELDFLGTIDTVCESCEGLRYNDQVLDVKIKNKNIGEILKMDFREALEFFSVNEKLASKLELFLKAGLSYLLLGQNGNTLSSGELQRLKLIGRLLQKQKGKTLYLFDEPSAGLHHKDVLSLVTIFTELRDQGHTLVLNEHHPYFAHIADKVVELGPGAGDQGGKII